MGKNFLAGLAVLLFLASAECTPHPTEGRLPEAASSTQAASGTTNLREQILGQWIHSREEDQSNVRVYRRPDYSFPPARGRDGFTFGTNGQFNDQPIGRGDAPVSQRWTWRIVDQKTIEITMDGSQSKRLLRVLSITPNKLELSETTADSQKN
jgi:hypothetical protein